MNNTRNKTIKHLLSNAKHGNLLSIFQLYENYSLGKYIEEDKLAANFFLEDLRLGFVDAKFCLVSLDLYEFRRLHNLKINFDSKLTVIIGDNGSGKTSIADSVAKILSWFNNNLIKHNANAKKLSDSDIHINATDYAEIIGNFSLNDSTKLQLSLKLAKSGYLGTANSSVTDSKQIGEIYRLLANDSKFSLPLFAFYSVERSNTKLPKPLETDLKETMNSRFSALKDSLEASAQLEDFSNTYIELTNLAEAEDSPEIRDAKQFVHSLETIIEKLYTNKDNSNNNALIEQLKIAQNNLVQLKTQKSHKHLKLLNLVNNAITTLVPDIKKLRVDRSTGKSQIIVNNFGNEVSISQLSQGQKSLVALTGDLALRLATLNPDMEEPLNSHGIVIIDEIELHLHPKWQKEIVLNFQKTFPNIQFIITTHSPHVLSTVDKKSIRILKFDSDGNGFIEIPSYQTKGVSSLDVLEQIMGTQFVPSIDEAQWIVEYSILIRNYQWENEEGNKLFSKLVTHFGENHPEIEKLRSEIRLQEFKRKVQQNKK